MSEELEEALKAFIPRYKLEISVSVQELRWNDYTKAVNDHWVDEFHLEENFNQFPRKVVADLLSSILFVQEGGALD